MSLLLAIDTEKNQLLHPEVMKLCESFSVLSEPEMLYVVLFADYNSIYKQFPEHSRKQKAMWHAFNENESELIETHRIKAAVQDYISLQYNPKIELIRRYEKKIASLLDTLDVDQSPTNGEKTTKFIDSLRKNIRELQYEVEKETIEQGVIKGDRQLSFLEKLLANKKMFKDVISTPPKRNNDK